MWNIKAFRATEQERARDERWQNLSALIAELAGVGAPHERFPPAIWVVAWLAVGMLLACVLCCVIFAWLC